MLRVAHLSDLHFAHPTYSLTQFFSKRWVGNFNLLFFRKRAYQTDHLWTLPSLLKELGVEWTILTGDFTTTARAVEFEEAERYVASLKMPTKVLPGNHDVYTGESERCKRFYSYLAKESPMREERVEHEELGKGWWWIGLDCALATRVGLSNGRFFPEMERCLERTLADIPGNAKIVVGNHFPLMGSGRPRHDLENRERLEAILAAEPRAKLYLHGHDHTPYILEGNTPQIFNAGSVAHHPGGTFYLVDLEEKECSLKRYSFDPSDHWTVDLEETFKFRSDR